MISLRWQGLTRKAMAYYRMHISDSGHEIVGLALLSPRAQHQALLPLDDEMRSLRSQQASGVC